MYLDVKYKIKLYTMGELTRKIKYSIFSRENDNKIIKFYNNL